MDPRIATQYARKPEYARPFFQYVADVTVQKITMTIEAERGGVSDRLPRPSGGDAPAKDALSTTPSTHPRRVVCSELKPKPLTMSCRWLLSCAWDTARRKAVSRQLGVLLRTALDRILPSS